MEALWECYAVKASRVYSPLLFPFSGSPIASLTIMIYKKRKSIYLFKYFIHRSADLPVHKIEAPAISYRQDTKSHPARSPWPSAHEAHTEYGTVAIQYK
jgi:hypothetical protein